MNKKKLNTKKSNNKNLGADQLLDIEESIFIATNSFQNGRIEDAKILLNKILLVEPRSAVSWYLYALITEQEGMYKDAIRYLKNALSIDPKNKKYLYMLGDIYYTLNYIKEGVELFEYIVEIQPDDYNGYYNLAVFQYKQNKFDRALYNYKKVLELDEKNINAIFNIGNILIDIKDFDNATKFFENVIELQPNSDDSYNNLGFLQLELGNLDRAIIYLNKAILINPRNFNAFNNLGKIYEKKFSYLEAFEYFSEAIILKPELADIYSNRGVVLNALKQFDKALIDFDKAISLNVNSAEAYSNRGNTLKEMMRYDDALKSYEKAIILMPNYAEAYNNQGVALQELMRTDEAMISYDKAINIDPNYADAYYNKAILLLIKNNLNAGWILYKWRWDIKLNNITKFDRNIINWDKQIDNNKIKILLWAEQGIGDEIFYFGMLKNFNKINAKITIAADNRLHSLFKNSMTEIEIIDKKTIHDENIIYSFDCQAPIGDIGLLCSVDQQIDHKMIKPFFNINSIMVSEYKNKIHNLKNKIVCGLSWKSSNQNFGNLKSLDLVQLSPLLLCNELEFISLQYGSTKEEIMIVEEKIGKKIHTFDDLDLYNDIEGLVSVISICDFVVTTSNITAHLTGSIGKKGIVLLPYSKGKIWYWHSGEGQSVWYPSLQLMSQKQMNDWTDPINRSKKWILEHFV
jgi:tetratricopeptide (TPR) repeat protein